MRVDLQFYHVSPAQMTSLAVASCQLLPRSWKAHQKLEAEHKENPNFAHVPQAGILGDLVRFRSWCCQQTTHVLLKSSKKDHEIPSPTSWFFFNGLPAVRTLGEHSWRCRPVGQRHLTQRDHGFGEGTFAKNSSVRLTKTTTVKRSKPNLGPHKKQKKTHLLKRRNTL